MPMPVEVPVASVLMGVYNRSSETALLERAVRSVLEQSFDDFEFLICDDGSSAEATALLDRLSDEDARIRLVRGIRETSLSAKLNACIQRARGRYFLRMDDDDESLPTRFEKQIRYLEENPEVDFVGCCVALSRAGQDVGMWILPPSPQVKDFYLTQPFVHPTLAFRRDALLAVHGYSQKRRCLKCEDYDLLLRMYEEGFSGENLQECLFRYTIPITAHGHRTMIDRVREMETRWVRFRALGLLPGAVLYVIKPVLTGLLPERLLDRIKGKRIHA